MDDAIKTTGADDRLQIADDAILTIATLAVGRVPRVSLVGQGSDVRGFFGIRSPGSGKGVKIETDGAGGVSVDLSVTVEYGAIIVDLAKELQDAVRSDIENMTGLVVTRADVHVSGIVFKDKVSDKAAAKGDKPAAAPAGDGERAASSTSPESAACEEADAGEPEGAGFEAGAGVGGEAAFAATAGDGAGVGGGAGTGVDGGDVFAATAGDVGGDAVGDSSGVDEGDASGAAGGFAAADASAANPWGASATSPAEPPAAASAAASAADGSGDRNG